MSLAIETDYVSAVLIAGTWYYVEVGTFYIDAFEYVDAPPNEVKNYDIHPNPGCSAGASWEIGTGMRMAVPLNQIQAVRFSRSSSKKPS